MLARIGKWFARRPQVTPFAGVLVEWSTAQDVGGTYFRGAMQHDFLGRFGDGERMSTGYLIEGPDEEGSIRATDGCYRLTPFPGGDVADTPPGREFRKRGAE